MTMMPKLTIYVSDPLRDELDRFKDEVNISQVCQEALTRAVRNASGPGRALLIDFILAQANWRFDKVKDFPDDHRNKQSTLALAGLGEFIRRMPMTHPAFRVINTLDGKIGSDVLMAGPVTTEFAAQFGFENGWEGPETLEQEEFVIHLVTIYAQEWLEDFDGEERETLKIEVDRILAAHQLRSNEKGPGPGPNLMPNLFVAAHSHAEIEGE
jgi:hypothetical protein